MDKHIDIGHRFIKMQVNWVLGDLGTCKICLAAHWGQAGYKCWTGSMKTENTKRELLN